MKLRQRQRETGLASMFGQTSDSLSLLLGEAREDETESNGNSLPKLVVMNYFLFPLLPPPPLIYAYLRFS